MMAVAASAVLLALGSTTPAEWPQWRGPFNTGMAIGDAPLRWDASDIRWKLPIPGRGHSTPVVAGHRMFLTTAVPTGKGTRAGRAGSRRRRRRRRPRASLRSHRHRSRHRKGRVAADGDGGDAARGLSPHLRQLRVELAGHRRHAGVCVLRIARPVCLRRERHAALEERLRRQMRMDLAFGEGTPLTLHDGRLLLHFDHLDTGFLVMLDPATGREIWRTQAHRTLQLGGAIRRACTPAAGRSSSAARPSAATTSRPGSSCGRRRSGREHHSAAGAARRPRVRDERPHRPKMLMAIRLGRTAPDRHRRLAWSTARGASYTPSPLLHDGRLYVVTDSGHDELLRRGDREAALPAGAAAEAVQLQGLTGRRRRQALSRDEEGDVVVVRMGDALEVLATNTLDDQSFIASPVIVDGDDLPAQPDAPVRHPLGGDHSKVHRCHCDCRRSRRWRRTGRCCSSCSGRCSSRSRRSAARHRARRSPSRSG